MSAIPSVASTKPDNAEGGEVVRDRLFYVHSVIFKAENTLFRVPVKALPQTDGIFAAMFELPVGNDSNKEGSSDDNPICLPKSVSAAAFRSFLTVVIPMPQGTVSPLVFEEWLDVLELANQWSLDSLRLKAIEKIDQMLNKKQTAIEMITLGKEYRVSRWVAEGYEQLGQREEALTRKERDIVGHETFGERGALIGQTQLKAFSKTSWLLTILGIQQG